MVIYVLGKELTEYGTRPEGCIMAEIKSGGMDRRIPSVMVHIKSLLVRFGCLSQFMRDLQCDDYDTSDEKIRTQEPGAKKRVTEYSVRRWKGPNPLRRVKVKETLMFVP